MRSLGLRNPIVSQPVLKIARMPSIRARATIDPHCAVEYVSVIEVVYYRDRESTCRVYLRVSSD